MTQVTASTLLCVASIAHSASSNCETPSGPQPPAVVALYNSEGAVPERAPDQLAGSRAQLEAAHQSRVLASENRGETLRHDRVIRHYQHVPAWPAGQAQQFQLPVLPGEAALPRRGAFVVISPAPSVR